MALKVIGAGFGRTGTRSLKTALEELGFGKCYHMEEVMKHPGHLKFGGKLWRETNRIGKPCSADTNPQWTGLLPHITAI